MRGKYSRLERHNKKQSNKQAFFYLLLSVLFIIGMIKWGLPAVIGFVTGSYQNEQSTDENDGVKPQKPSLGPLPEATFSATIKVAGLGQTGTTIKLRLNGLDKAEMETDNQGGFEFAGVELLKGENRLEVL